MNIKDLSKKSLDFTIKRVAEIIGLFLIFISVLFFIALLSYSPEDPNFIFTNNEDIKNILGFRGSYISDFFFQSIGLISFLISFTIFFTGINLIRNKNYLIIVENIFYLILYSIIGSIFLIVCLGRSLVGHFKPDHHFGFEAAAWYWHFVDVVWLFLFFAIYWWGGLGGTVH